MRDRILVLTAALAVTGCSDPKRASDANFKKAIDTYLAREPVCLNAPSANLGIRPAGHENDRSSFPAYVALPSKATMSDVLFKTSIQNYEPLAAAGLISSRTGTIEQKNLFGPTNTAIPVRIYELTDKGRNTLSTRTNSFFGSGEQFCYGTPEVTRIVQFTEPNSALGMTFSEVAYTYRLKDRADWVKAPAMLAAYPSLRETTKDGAEGRATLILTNHGWVDQRAGKV